MQPHEYSVIGHSRTTVGRYLGVIAGASAALLYLSAGVVLHWLEKTQITSVIPDIVFWPISAGLIYVGVHWWFNSSLWKCKWASLLINVPNIDGTWVCEGKTMDQDGNITHEWGGRINITQTWEKITVFMRGPKGRSYSVIASLIREGQEYRLMYRYAYEANAGEPVQPHVGFCDLTFNKELTEANGDYFNNKGRWTFGQMKLVRE